MYDRNIKMYDEPHTPVALERQLLAGKLNKGKLITEQHNNSYYLQMKTIKDLKIKHVLEIGPGESFIPKYMKSIGIQYDTLDIVPSTNPTYLSRLEDADPSMIRKRYGAVCAFQVLEHSPYDRFSSNLAKMAALSRNYIVISIPYSCFGFRLSFKTFRGQGKRSKYELSRYFPKNLPNRKYRPEYIKEFPWACHYWELGREGFPLSRIKNDIISQRLRIIDTFHSDNPFHFFIIAQKTES
ncbi:MAG TPA: hypothetical protein ENH10_04520 [Bacteroidetes bacterium]|nr:hypothetical protein BMS3Bbin04_01063 [bacterium BMS3Bbin04]HDO65279.1 hypothetical protein [Bacteroidota bacterium]HEX04404.1 hypothetical protein [Bacteroidota bacterium]